MYCFQCNAEVESEVRTVQKTYPVKGEEITINATVRFCKCCGTDLWDDELDEKNLLNAYNEYRRRHKLLQPDDIHNIRTKYDMTQIGFARILGFGDKTITRYENGSIADAAQNNLIELTQQPSNFEILLRKNKDKISDDEYQRAIDALDKLKYRVCYNNLLKTYKFTPNVPLQFTMEQKYWGDISNGKTSPVAI